MQHCRRSGSEGREVEEGTTFTVEADFVVGADGVNSTIRDEMASAGAACRAHRLEDLRPTTYRTISIPVPEGERTDFNFSARNGDIGIEALPNVEGQVCGVVLFEPDDTRVTSLADGRAARKLFEELFPIWPTPLLSDEEFEAFAHRPNAKLPQFMFCGPELHRGGQAVLLGDAIHSVKPYFGLGVNSAFEDVVVLGRCLDETGGRLDKALPLFSTKRAEEARALVESQYTLDQPADYRFVAKFLLPIILDNVFNKALPQVFSPNLIVMLQDEAYTFQEVRQKKALDRTLQAAVLLPLGAGILGAGAAALGALVSAIAERIPAA
mmetsp:Transcript_47786/g.153949  ORF Transcript_47786/g.153949 Transcript_47786/m.153949 type:complete len:324 (+) Transcript_47786:707-1678(+)